ncbi:PspC domain-containing protein, partial [Escherichia sp. HC-CC]
MAGINLNKKLWRIPQQGMVRGVCAGIANYFDVPVKLVRILVVSRELMRDFNEYSMLMLGGLI